MFIEFFLNILANELAIIAPIPVLLSANGACSLDDPHPKLSSANIISPVCTISAKSGILLPQRATFLSSSGGYDIANPGSIWSVSIFSPRRNPLPTIFSIIQPPVVLQYQALQDSPALRFPQLF